MHHVIAAVLILSTFAALVCHPAFAAYLVLSSMWLFLQPLTWVVIASLAAYHTWRVLRFCK